MNSSIYKNRDHDESVGYYRTIKRGDIATETYEITSRDIHVEAVACPYRFLKSI